MNLPYALTEEQVWDVGELAVHHPQPLRAQTVRAGAQLVAVVYLYSPRAEFSSHVGPSRLDDRFERIRTFFAGSRIAFGRLRDRLSRSLHERLARHTDREESLLHSEAMKYLAKFVHFAGCYLQHDVDAKRTDKKPKQRLVLPRKCIYMMAQVYRRTTGLAPSFSADTERKYSPFVRFVIAFARTYGWEKTEGKNEFGLTEVQMVRDIEDAYKANPAQFEMDPRASRPALQYAGVRRFSVELPSILPRLPEWQVISSSGSRNA